MFDVEGKISCRSHQEDTAANNFELVDIHQAWWSVRYWNRTWKYLRIELVRLRSKAAATMRRTGTNIKVLMKRCHRLTGNLSVHIRGVVHLAHSRIIGNSKLHLELDTSARPCTRRTGFFDLWRTTRTPVSLGKIFVG
jgi:hypothetical protein